MPALTGTGSAKVTDCQPLASSLVKVAWASRVPFVVHRLPVWVPVFAAAL